MGMSNYAENACIAVIFGKTSAWGVLSVPPTLYVALSTATITDADTGGSIVQPTYTGYARVATIAANWDVAVDGTIDNIAALTFPQCTAAGGMTVTYWAICDAASGGNMIFYAALTASKVINVGDSPSFAIGALVISCD